MSKKQPLRGGNAPDSAKENEQAKGRPDGDDASGVSPERRAIIEMLVKLRFRRRLFGGVDEADVWRKLEDLNRLYEEALKAERIRYDALLERRSACGEGWEKAGDE